MVKRHCQILVSISGKKKKKKEVENETRERRLTTSITGDYSDHVDALIREKSK
jgi:hypothetical protein